jgi:hypothetical protein
MGIRVMHDFQSVDWFVGIGVRISATRRPATAAMGRAGIGYTEGATAATVMRKTHIDADLESCSWWTGLVRQPSTEDMAGSASARCRVALPLPRTVGPSAAQYQSMPIGQAFGWGTPGHVTLCLGTPVPSLLPEI